MKTEKIIEKAEKFRSKGFFRESLYLWIRIYKKAIKKNDPGLSLECLVALGDLNRILGNFEKSAKFYEEAIALAEALEDETSLADSLSGLALCYKAKGQWKEGLKIIKKARKLYESHGDKKGIAFTFWAEGTIWRFGGRIKKSLQSFKEALAIFRKLKDKSAIGYTYCGLGGSSRVNGDFKISLYFYKKANSIFNEINDRFGLAYSYCGIGNAYRMFDDIKEAEKNFKKALKLYQEIGDIVSSSYTLWSMAILEIFKIYRSRKDKKDYTEAVNYILKAEKNFRKCNDPRGLIYCLLLRGMINFLRGKRSIGKKIFKKAYEKAKIFDFALEKKYAERLLNGKFLIPHNIP